MPRFVFVKKQVAPGAIGSVLNNGNSTYGFQLNWVAVTNAVKYKVYRATSINGPWDLVATVNAPTVTYTDSPFSLGAQRLYRVAAVREQGSSSTGSDGKAPPTTYAQSLLYTHEVVTINWVAMEGADSIRIYRNGTPIGFASSALSTSYIDDSTALTWGTEYSYQVAGIVGGVEYDKSDPLLVWTMPNAPTNVTASAPNDQQQPVSLSWTASTGATGYKIYRDGAYLTDSATNSYSDTTTVWGTGYEYQISATNTGGEGPKTQPVVLEWSVPVTGVTVSYNIYRGGVFLASDTSSPFSDTTTVYGTTYTYTIKGVNQIGEEGPQSSSASIGRGGNGGSSFSDGGNGRIVILAV
eukprot:tig00000367_g24443.t1